MSPVSFGVDVDLCTACQLCVVACKDEHTSSARLPWTDTQPIVGQFWIRVESLEGGPAPRVNVAHLPIMCQHCENAPCMKACPEEGAIKRRPDGLVWIDPEICTGCRLCEPACPYDVIYFNAELEVAQKCTGCAHRIDDGQSPRCVEICPHDALTVTVGDEPLAGEAYRPEHFTEPLVRWRGLPGVTIGGRVVNPSGADVVSDANVALQNLATDEVSETVTDAFGEFRWRGDGIGHRFLVSIEKDGHNPVQRVVTGAFGADLGTIHLVNPSIVDN